MLFSDFQIIYLSEIFLSYLMCIHFESYLFSLSIAVLFLRLQVLVTSFGELGENEYLDPRTALVAIVDHVKQVSSAVFKKSCTSTSYVNKKVLMTHEFFFLFGLPIFMLLLLNWLRFVQKSDLQLTRNFHLLMLRNSGTLYCSPLYRCFLLNM